MITADTLNCFAVGPKWVDLPFFLKLYFRQFAKKKKLEGQGPFSNYNGKN